MSRRPPSPTALRVADLSTTASNTFAYRPDQAALAALAEDLGLLGLRKLSFEGKLTPLGQTDWQLEARLGATATQACVVTLDPVTTRIDIDVSRRLLADYADPDDPESEMPEDDSVEALQEWIDPYVVMTEALALALPDYPRKSDAALGQLVYTEPGRAPMTDEDAKPFAGLADLKAAMEKDTD